LARIEYDQKQLLVSTEFIDASFAFRVGSMLQFIGELSVSPVRSEVAAWYPSMYVYLADPHSYAYDRARFINSLQQKGELVLRARVARCIDGMDLNLYEQALQLMRAHVRSAQPMAMDV
jgi:hypothetical protein